MHYIPSNYPLLAKYTLTFIISKILIHCPYLPSCPQLEGISAVFGSLYLNMHSAIPIVVCGDLNAWLGSRTGDTTLTSRGRLLQQKIDLYSIINWNQHIAFG